MQGSKIYCGFDNGVTASIGIITPEDSYIFSIPTFSAQDYTKRQKNMTRVDSVALRNKIQPFSTNCVAYLERPLSNPKLYYATCSAMRSLEALLITLESLTIPYQFLDSKEWQHVLLPKGIVGSAEQKKASLDIGIRLFPKHKEYILKHKDADGLLLAEFARRNN